MVSICSRICDCERKLALATTKLWYGMVVAVLNPQLGCPAMILFQLILLESASSVLTIFCLRSISLPPSMKGKSRCRNVL